ncbi:peptidase [Streptomyces sp. NBC_00234]|uniref:peptidase n=1 Tax=Streptomyces sp. NBC_00234 TaxID=2903638 RepID=UPI002E2ACE2B|nr:peptidase [Streptomyces sp. NBC_00234]
MTRISPRTALRRAAGGLAAAGLLAAGSLAVGAPARAAGPEFTLGGAAETALHPYPSSGAPRTTSLGITVDNPSQDEENGGYEGEVTVTFDLSGIAGVADVSFGEDAGADCEVTGTTAVCHDYGVHPGLSTLAELDLAAAEGSEDGASGTIRVSGTADGATFVPFSTKVVIGGPDLVMKQLPFDQEPVPGQVQPAPVTFTNEGTAAADGVLLTLMYSRGLDLPERYSNCAYTDGADTRAGIPWSTALCSFAGSYEAGATYTLAEPLSVEATDRAFYDTFVYRINEDGAAQRAAQRAGARFDRGTGPALALKKVPAALSTDLDPHDNQQEVDFRTENTADFVAYGDELTGAEGDTVTARIGFRNAGPAWIGYLRSGESVATLDLTVPEGATVTGKPDACRGVTADGAYREQQLGAPRYVCETGMTVRDGADVAQSFDLKITKLVQGASGAVEVRNLRLADPALPFDPKPANNTARLVLNDSGSQDSGGTSDGSAGSTGGGSAGTTSGSGTSGSAGGSGTSGTSSASGSTGSAGASGSQGSTGSTGGGLAATGSAVLWASAAAVVALAAGGVLYAVSRHRTRQG